MTEKEYYEAFLAGARLMQSHAMQACQVEADFAREQTKDVHLDRTLKRDFEFHRLGAIACLRRIMRTQLPLPETNGSPK